MEKALAMWFLLTGKPAASDIPIPVVQATVEGIVYTGETVDGEYTPLSAPRSSLVAARRSRSTIGFGKRVPGGSSSTSRSRA